MKSMKRPNTRAEFERNFYLLHESIAKGKMRFAQGISTEGLSRVRFLPNGRIDFLSVDESTRLKANMMSQFADEELMNPLKAKKADGQNDPQPPAQPGK